MAAPAQLELRLGWSSETGRRIANEDYVGACLGTDLDRARQGAVVAIADGVSGAPGGRIAAELAVRSFIEFYLGGRDTIGIGRAAAAAAEAVNGWIHGQGRTDPQRAGMATTLTALILRGRHAHLVHIGDSRAWRLRNGRLTRLTEDHVQAGPERSHILRRAIGLEDVLRADYAVEPLVEHDRLVLTTDGVHGTLGSGEMARLLMEEASSERAAARLVAEAIAAGSQDNASALVLDVLTLPAADRTELTSLARDLPIREPPDLGARIDGYRIGELLSDGRYSRIHRATDERDGTVLVLKFPKPAVAEDAAYRAAFVREGWVAARLRNPWLGEVIEPAPGRQSCLYTVMPYYPGETLEQRLSRRPPVALAEGIAIGARLAKAVGALHRAGVIHRDIKPENVILGPDSGVRLIDFGIARLPGLDTGIAAELPGTPNFLAPELFEGDLAGDERTDLYALGVTLYRMFSSAWPYGEVEAFQRPRFGSPVPLTKHRPDLPAWLELLLARAVAVDPAERPGDAIELALDLEAGPARVMASPRQRPLYTRNPVLVWQAIAAILLLLLLSSLVRR